MEANNINKKHVELKKIEAAKQQEIKRVIIIGAGLVGTLQAIYFAKRNYVVDVYEYRDDPRLSKCVRGRSINLSLSLRGREALNAVGIENEVIELGIPIHARMIHPANENPKKNLYGDTEYHYLTMDRQKLIEKLLSIAESHSNVQFHFKHKFSKANFEKGEVILENDGGEIKETARLIVGCDGAFSAVRRNLMTVNQMSFSQKYITHGYKELSVPAKPNNTYAWDENCVHIWPRDTFLMIGLPNKDKTFTCTLFMSFQQFEEMTTRQKIIEFFSREFPDAFSLMDEDMLLQQYEANPVGNLFSIKCFPYHYSDKVVIVGDAAHSMLPFYAQGMNCGFEDCLVLHRLLDQHGEDIESALKQYSITRNPDAEAITDLAKCHYVELRSHVNSHSYSMRQKLDQFLHWLAPSHWYSMYIMTTFTCIPYHQIMKKKRTQDKLLLLTSTVVLSACFAIAITLL